MNGRKPPIINEDLELTIVEAMMTVIALASTAMVILLPFLL